MQPDPHASAAASSTPPGARLVAEVAARAPSVEAGHAVAVRSMFQRISPTYDLLNRLLSAGIDRRWRARALDLVDQLAPEGPLLDSCAGTLDLSAGMVQRWPGRPLIAGDFARDMLVAGRPKLGGPALPVVCDAMRLPFASGRFAGMTCGFGMRNLADPERGIAEALRVLVPGGVFVTLEFFRPTRLSTRVFHAVYGQFVLPTVGKLLSGDGEAYGYLAQSMKGFLTRDEYEAAMRRAGFREVFACDLTLGIASLVWGIK
jgi:ubiquinone/menaquinone biosynthesis methyltransferase